MFLRQLFIFLCLLLIAVSYEARAENFPGAFTAHGEIHSAFSVTTGENINIVIIDSDTDPASVKALRRKKWISGMLAFPFPLGFIGAHRVMLGCKPWVPLVYVATFGGCFGILPLIDFIVLVTADDVSKYENNPNIFMWIN